MVWLRPAVTQAATRTPLVGILIGPADTPWIRASLIAFRDRLQELGWTEGSSVRFEVRWANSDFALMRAHAAEIVALAPHAILVQSNPSLAALKQETRTIPIVFVHVADPVGSGFIDSLASPGGNITGLTNFEASMGGKWLEVLQELAPHTARFVALFHPETAAHHAFLRSMEAAATARNVALIRTGVREGVEIERAIVAVAHTNAGIIALPHTITERYRDLIIDRAAQYRLPAIYAFRQHSEAGGLVSYGIDAIELNRRAALYVDRILRGTKPAELPVAAAMKFELVINLKAAKSLGLTVPRSLIARADEVIE